MTSGSMSPRSLFPTGQRFPIPLPVMTSLDQSGASLSPKRAPFTTALAKGGTEAVVESYYSVMNSQKKSGGQQNETLALR